jgi:hypothetical protein
MRRNIGVLRRRCGLHFSGLGRKAQVTAAGIARRFKLTDIAILFVPPWCFGTKGLLDKKASGLEQMLPLREQHLGEGFQNDGSTCGGCAVATA